MRSKLFVPGSRPELFEKALASDADALSFDLEDAVPPDGKAAARAQVAAFLQSDVAQASGKTMIVRVNGLHTPDFADDAAALAEARFDLVNLPKCDDARSVEAAAAVIGARPVLATIETARGLARAGEIAAHENVVGLQVGLNDLFATLGIERRAEHVHAALWTVRMGAGDAGCFAMDGAWPEIADEQGFRAEAELGRSLGFVGKSCIHPKQVVLANAVFAHDAAALDRAERIVSASETARAAGHGAFVLDGEMIDRPAIDRARRMLALEGGR